MKNSPKLLVFAAILLVIAPYKVHSQFITTNDAANLGGGYYRMTEDLTYEIGYVWNQYYYDLTTPLSVTGKFHFGWNTAGADGICFVLQNNCAGASGVASGGGIGYSQMAGQSLAIEFDTYQNITGTGNQDNADPTYDHIAIEKSGDVNHATSNTLVAPVQTSSTATNVKDGAWHDFKITYDPTTHLIEVYFDGVLRISYTYDILNNIFGGNAFVYWGFSSSTGGQTNYQQLYINSSVASNNPLRDTTICTGSVTVNMPALSTYNGKNLALRHTAVASSIESIAFPASFVNDGDKTTTRWSSQASDPQWIRIDLGTLYDIDSVVLYWETAYASQYYLQFTDDTNNVWTNAYHQTAGTGGKETIIVSGTNVRYIRVYGVQRGTVWGYSLWELEAYGKAKYIWSPNNGTISPDIYSSNPTFNPTVTTTYKVLIPDPCIGYTTDSFTITVNCSQPVKFLELNISNNNSYKTLNWTTTEETNTEKFTIEFSNDGISFQPIGSVPTNNTSGINNYSFKDYSHYEGTGYYRIVEYDKDENKTFSQIKSISNFTSNIAISPNPSNGNFNITGSCGNDTQLNITIINPLGQVVYSVKIQTQMTFETSVNISSLSPAMYLVYVTGEATNHIEKIIIK